MRSHIKIATIASAAIWMALATAPAGATGVTTCNSGPQSSWKPQNALEQQLKGQGWQVRRIKIDGGCYEVYGLNDKGERVESYFHPVTLEHVVTSRH